MWAAALKYLGLMVVDAFALVIVYTLVEDDNLLLALVIAVITVMMNVFLLVPSLYPFKWMSPGLALVTLLVIYPIIYTVIVSLTNYSDGHLFTKEQTINLLSRQKYLPDDATVYNWSLFASESGEYALWLTREDGDVQETLFAVPGEPITVVSSEAAQEPPETYEGFRQLSRAESVQAATTIQDMQFGPDDDSVGIKSRNEAGRPFRPRYVYDAAQDAIIDRADGTVYHANEELGCFMPQGARDCSAEAGALIPGYRVFIGTENFVRLVNDPGLSGPLVRIFGWTVTFALLTVLLNFGMGLFMAIILNDPYMPGRKLIRSLLFIPYAIPGVISILAWRGMFNESLGVINANLNDIFGVSVPWFSDPGWAKFAVLLVNLWLSYPYMMLICSGALQTIPADIYEAAAVDGATGWQRFWSVTLPLLLIVVGPLLIASFVFSFNNYLIIEGLTQGDPPMAGTITPAGHTDILINYTYNLAFGSDRGADYGYASAITLIIFVMTAAITAAQYRLTRRWEEMGANV
ncbi:MAG: maltose ABC transporter permease MalF [Anaerolineae bacterium]